LKGVVDNKAFRKGSWGAAIVDVLKRHPEDILIEGKRGFLTPFPAPIWISFCATMEFKPWRWQAFLRTAAWNQPCALPTSADLTS